MSHIRQSRSHIRQSRPDSGLGFLALGLGGIPPLGQRHHAHRRHPVSLPGKGNSNSHGARPVHLIITMIKWIRTNRLSIKNSLYAPSGGGESGHAERHAGPRDHHGDPTSPPGPLPHRPPAPGSERVFFIDNFLIRIHFIIEMIRWTGLAPWEFEFSFPGSNRFIF